jgi:hypothetical protein
MEKMGIIIEAAIVSQGYGEGTGIPYRNQSERSRQWGVAGTVTEVFSVLIWGSQCDVLLLELL